jgi:precorrin-6A/cobalt-precorrin-6A reductase
VEAASIAGVPLEIRTRKPWSRQPGDTWIEVETLEQARDAIPPAARVLLALGSQHIGLFASRDDVHFVVRMIDPRKHRSTCPITPSCLAVPATRQRWKPCS